jgi:hypothetical protein
MRVPVVQALCSDLCAVLTQHGRERGRRRRSHSLPLSPKPQPLHPQVKALGLPGGDSVTSVLCCIAAIAARGGMAAQRALLSARAPSMLATRLQATLAAHAPGGPGRTSWALAGGCAAAVLAMLTHPSRALLSELSQVSLPTLLRWYMTGRPLQPSEMPSEMPSGMTSGMTSAMEGYGEDPYRRQSDSGSDSDSDSDSDGTAGRGSRAVGL